jgi:thioredoxin reductase (NADPH)
LRSVVVFDAGDARAKLIPETRNCPGFPEGISGKNLLGRLSDQARTYGAELVYGLVDGVERRNGSFVLTTTSGVVKAARVILATGLVDKMPAIAGLKEAIAVGSIRLCPVCDAYEARERCIGVIGPVQLALKEALFLKDYSPHIKILASDRDEVVSEVVRKKTSAAGIEIWDITSLVYQNGSLAVAMADGSPAREIVVVYPSVGCDVRSELGEALGADCDEEGYTLVSRHLETSVPGLYAIGDVAKALNQIAVGFGHAAIAAAHIHNALRGCGELHERASA